MIAWESVGLLTRAARGSAIWYTDSMPLRRRRALWLAALTILICSLLGGVYGPRVRAAAAPAEDDLRESIRTFARAYHLIEENYADRVNGDTAIYNGAIPGMLRKLDPHSQFFDPEQLDRKSTRLNSSHRL